jgi:glycosyltransferase involved in cell wall biosynthesis
MSQTKENLHLNDMPDMHIRNVGFYSFNFQDALSHLRLVGAANYLGWNVIHGVENGQVYPDRANSGDVIVMQRDFPRALEAYQAIQVIAKSKHIPMILDIDDLLFELPEDHPDRTRHTFSATLLPIFLAMLEADLITVTTQPLRDYVSDINKNVVVLPNYLDDQFWHPKAPAQNPQAESKITIGYMGGHTHQPDLAIIIPVIEQLSRQYNGRLEFVFWGTQPPKELSGNPSVQWHEQITWNYQDFAAYFQAQTADIFVAPLADNLFNRCKSSIKYLEYGALGVPGVYSRVEPYSSMIAQGVNGFLASTAEEWLETLVRLVENPALRQSIAANAREHINSNWLLSDHASHWLAAYQKASGAMDARPYADPKMIKMIRNLSQQIIAMEGYTRDQLKLKTEKITELEHQLAIGEATLEGITNSRTWKLALLFRRISEFFAPLRN